MSTDPKQIYLAFFLSFYLTCKEMKERKTENAQVQLSHSLPPSFALQIVFITAVCPAGPLLALSMVVPCLLPHLFAISDWLNKFSPKVWSRWAWNKRSYLNLNFITASATDIFLVTSDKSAELFLSKNMCLLAALLLPMLKSAGNQTGRGRPTHLMPQLPLYSWDKKPSWSCAFRTDTKGPLRPHHCYLVAKKARPSSHQDQGEVLEKHWGKSGLPSSMKLICSWDAHQTERCISRFEECAAWTIKRRKGLGFHRSHPECQWLG